MKSSNVVKIIILAFICGLIVLFYAASYGFSADTEVLIINSGFEDDFTGWSHSHSGGTGTETIETDECYAGQKSLRMQNDNSTSQTATQSIGPLMPGKSYILSAMFKASPDHGAYIRLKDSNWKDVNGRIVSKYFTAKIYGTGRWEKISQIIRIPLRDDFGESTESHNWSVMLYGTHPSGNSDPVYYDDVKLALGNMFLPQFGAVNDDDAKSLDFGSQDETAGGISYTASAMTDIENDGNVSFRSIMPRKSLYIEFPAFNVDANGLPLTPMLLEIHYKDTIDEVKYRDSTYRTYHRAMVYSKIDFYSTEPYSRKDRQYYELFGLGHIADGQWEYEQFVFQKTPFQLLRAIDGKFTFKIAMPNKGPDDASLYLPIDYISLRKITEDQSGLFSSKNRELLAFYKVDMPADEPLEPVNYNDPDLVIFTRDIMQPVYPHTKPAADEVDKELCAVSAPGEMEPLSFAIFSQGGASSVNFGVTDLRNAENGAVIAKENISIFKVVCAEKRVNPYSSNRPRGYALIPDYLEGFSSLDIAAGTAQRIWLKVNIPVNAAGGVYAGILTVKKGATDQRSIPIRLNVLGIPLDLPENLNTVYSDPYLRTYSTEMNKVCKLFRETGFDMFAYPQCSNIVVDGKIVDFNIQAVNAEVEKFKQENLTRKGSLIISAPASAIYSQIFKTPLTSEDLNVYARLSSAEFVEAYGMLIRKIVNLGTEKGVSFIFTLIDEPGGDPYKRILADRIATIIKDNGGKTTVTYYTSCDGEVPSGDYITPNGTLPPLTNLVDYKVWSASSMGPGYLKGYEDFGYYTTSTSYLRNPIYNRFLHGLMAVATDAKIVSAYAMGDYIGSPFDDFDATGHYIYPFTYPDFLFAYPTWNDGELLYTLALEGIREGIKDAKYAATLKRLISEYPTSPLAVEASAYLGSIKDKIDKDYWNTCTNNVSRFGYYDRILEDVSDSADPGDFGSFTKIRANIAAYINLLLDQAPDLGSVVYTAKYIITANLDGYDKDDQVIDFGQYGIWIYYNNQTWDKLHNITSESIISGNLDADIKDDLIIDFGQYGIWIYYNNQTWQKLHDISPEYVIAANMDHNNIDELVMDYGQYGIWIYYNNHTWVNLHNISPESIISASLDDDPRDDLVMDYGQYGIWIYYNNNTWLQLHTLNPESITRANLDSDPRDDLVIDFGTNGIWVYYNNNAWVKIHD